MDGAKKGLILGIMDLFIYMYMVFHHFPLFSYIVMYTDELN